MSGHPIRARGDLAENAVESGKFYRAVFGWQITKGEHGYANFEDEGGLRGGLADPNEPTYEHGRVLVYLATDDVDASLAAVEAHGGSTVKGKEMIPEIGEWAVFTDPGGNTLGLWKSLRTVRG